MKRLQAVIRPERLDDVQDALAAAGFAGFMVHDIRGHGTEATPSGEWRGGEGSKGAAPPAAYEACAAQKTGQS